jgi:hypothetical protein
MSNLTSSLGALITPTGANALPLVADALIYFAVLAALFRARQRIGIGAFFCALGVMHFLETYLASILYVALPFGIVASPGSAVLFTGKLMLLLLVYIREDAVVGASADLRPLDRQSSAVRARRFDAPARRGGAGGEPPRRFRFSRRDGRPDDLGHADPVRRLHHDDPDLRARARLPRRSPACAF